MNDEKRILKEIKDVLKELDEQGRMKYTQIFRYISIALVWHIQA